MIKSNDIGESASLEPFFLVGKGSAYVRTEHILLGMVRDGGGVGADILDTLGVLGKVRAQVFKLLG